MNKKQEPKPIKDGSTAGGRDMRYARVSGTVAGLAARLAGERYLGIPIELDNYICP